LSRVALSPCRFAKAAADSPLRRHASTARRPSASLQYREFRSCCIPRASPARPSHGRQIRAVYRTVTDVSTWTRGLAAVTAEDVTRLRAMNRALVTERVRAEGMRRITVDFDGSVLTTRGHAEGSAIGYNRKRKGARSYYPLFCTVAQTGQFFDMLHRPGNVHDSRDAKIGRA